MRLDILGGADGQTVIFLVGKTEPGWINGFGLLLILLLLFPNIIYAVKFHSGKHRNTGVDKKEELLERKGEHGGRASKGIDRKIELVEWMEQLGRYSCMFLMIFDVGVGKLGFPSVLGFLIYAIGNMLLLVAYWLVWMFYIRRQDFGKKVALAVIPTMMFLISGVTLRYLLLIFSSLIFGASHIYITCHGED